MSKYYTTLYEDGNIRQDGSISYEALLPETIALALSSVGASLLANKMYYNYRQNQRESDLILVGVAFSHCLFSVMGLVVHAPLFFVSRSDFSQSWFGVVLLSVFNASLINAIGWSAMVGVLVGVGKKFIFRLRYCYTTIGVASALYFAAWVYQLSQYTKASPLIVLSKNSELPSAHRTHLICLVTSIFLFSSYMFVLFIICWSIHALHKRNMSLQRSISPIQWRLAKFLAMYLLLGFPYITYFLWCTFLPPEKVVSSSLCKAIIVLLYLLPLANALIYGTSLVSIPSCLNKSEYMSSKEMPEIENPVMANNPNAHQTPETKEIVKGSSMEMKELQGLSDIHHIASGAYGDVYKALWLGIDVAMKLVRLPVGLLPEQAVMYQTYIKESETDFLEEAMLCSRLRHPNIALFMKIGLYDSKLCILSEYCGNGSLTDVLKRPNGLSWKMKLQLAFDIAKGLTYLHARNPTYIHRDLKSSNILVTESWQAKIGDFGTSRVAHAVQTSRERDRMKEFGKVQPSEKAVKDLSMTYFAGTWRWNAPEILRDPTNCQYNRATDVYSFGIILWEIATNGRIPFGDIKFDSEVRDYVLRNIRPAFPELSSTPQGFSRLIYQCWSHYPQDRPGAKRISLLLKDMLEQEDSCVKKKPNKSEPAKKQGGMNIHEYEKNQKKLEKQRKKEMRRERRQATGSFLLNPIQKNQEEHSKKTSSNVNFATDQLHILPPTTKLKKQRTQDMYQSRRAGGRLNDPLNDPSINYVLSNYLFE